MNEKEKYVHFTDKAKKLFLEDAEKSLEEMAVIKNDEPNVIYVKREHMERFLTDFSLKGTVNLSFKVVDKLD